MAPNEKMESARQMRLSKENKPSAPSGKTLAETREQRESRKKPEPERKPMSLQAAAKARRAGQRPSSVPPMVGNQYFKVFFGSTQINFSKVSSVQRTVETETFQEGGENTALHVLTAPGKRESVLTLEKGISADDEMTKIMKALAPGTRISVPVTITLYHHTGKEWSPVRSWGFEDGMVSSWELGELNGLGSDVILEKLTITHAGLEELEVR